MVATKEARAKHSSITNLHLLSAECFASITEFIEAFFHTGDFIKNCTLLSEVESANNWHQILLHSMIILRINSILCQNEIDFDLTGENRMTFYMHLTDAVTFYCQINKIDNGELAMLLTRLREIFDIN